MAIFGFKDKDAHLLTQFYQLEFDPENPIGGELDKWLFLQMHHFRVPIEAYEPANERELFSDYWKSERWYQPATRNEVRESIREIYRSIKLDLIKDVAEIQGLVKRLMDAMADRSFSSNEDPGQSHIEDLEDLNNRARSLIPTVKPSQDEVMRHPNQPLQIIWGSRDMPSPQADTEILSSLILELGRGYDAFRRCPTCGSVFITGRVDKRRCSRRCNEREAKIIRNGKKTEEETLKVFSMV